MRGQTELMEPDDKGERNKMDKTFTNARGKFKLFYETEMKTNTDHAGMPTLQKGLQYF